MGSTSKSCDQETGQCPCRAGREGTQCDEVQEGTFKPDMDTIVIKPDPIPVIDGSGGDEGEDGDDGGRIDGGGDEDEEEGTGLRDCMYVCLWSFYLITAT